MAKRDTDRILDIMARAKKLMALAVNPTTPELEADIAGLRLTGLIDRYQIRVDVARNVVLPPLDMTTPLAFSAEDEVVPETEDSNVLAVSTRRLLPIDDHPLSKDQATAVQTVLAALRRGVRECSIAGLAGTGKTWLVRTLVAVVWFELGMEAQFCSPTGKAASRLSELAKVRARTIHSVLYSRVVEDEDFNPTFLDPVSPVKRNSLLIVDEASMVDEQQATDIRNHLPPGSAVLYLGDPRQCKPVEGAPGVNLREPTYELTTIHRQAADSGIITAAHLSLSEKRPRRLVNKDVSLVGRSSAEEGTESVYLSAAKWLSDRRAENADPDYATLITFRREDAARLNQLTRRERGFETTGLHLSIGEVIVVGTNNPPCYNGEVYTIKTITRTDVSDLEQMLDYLYLPDAEKYTADVWKGPGSNPKRYLILRDTIGRKTGEFKHRVQEIIGNRKQLGRLFLHVDRGECLTIHRAQGSQYKHVGFVWTEAVSNLFNRSFEDATSLVYTALTRASEKVVIFKTEW